MFRKVGKGLLVLPGSPSTLLVPTENGYYVIDPGSKANRVMEIQKAGKVRGVLLTHMHSDHVLAADGLPSEEGVYAPFLEACGVESEKLRRAMIFGGSAPEGLVYHVRAVPVKVDRTFRLPFKVEGVEAVPLPGHTYGQVGFLTESGVLYAADSFFGDKLLENAVIPYYMDYQLALETLKFLRENARSYRKIIPSHGPIVEGKRAEELLDLNLEALERVKDLVMNSLDRPRSAESITYKILRDKGRDPTPSSIILSTVTVKSVLSYLYQEGKVDVKLSEEGLLWWWA